MSCPFGHTSLKAAQQMEAAQLSQQSNGAPAPATPPKHNTNGNQGTPFSPPMPPFAMFTGGPRTSLGTENAHPLSIWMKELQARGGLKGVDIDKELRDLQLDEISSKQADKTWKEKRDRPPVEFAGVQLPESVAASVEDYVPMNHNAHVNEPLTQRYDQEITYWNYIHPDILTRLQTGRQGKGLNHHDEHLFILVHQVFELWFKQVIWELEYVRNCLIGFRDPNAPQQPVERNPLKRCVERLNRADKILRLATEGYSIMETMDPADFLEFRDFLSPSSGFQSVQLREMEIILGLKDEERIACAGRHYREAFMANGDNKTGAFDRRLREKTLKEAVYIFLARMQPTNKLPEFLEAYFNVLSTQNQEKSKDFEEELALLAKMAERSTDEREKKYLKDLTEKAQFGKTLAANSNQDVAKFFHDPVFGTQRASVLFLFTYHSHPDLRDAAELVEGLLKFEQAVLLWRNRHARMVETFIGRRAGTGGSSGVEYIDQTASAYRIFTDLWRTRSLCVARSKIAWDVDNGVQQVGKLMEHLESDYEALKKRMEQEDKEAKAKGAAAAAAAAAQAK